ncbi:MAG TPA: NAD(P)-dependent oxidoreductase [Streptosporangiaceae bacterium]|jgi:phosphoglycerate dehydrogenase-like enzyme
MPRILFGVPRFSAELSWTDLAPELPGWEILVSPRGRVADHLDGVDVVCPWGSPMDAATLRAGTFGLVQQFGVGLERVDVAAATELGVYVARIPGDAGGNADSVAEIALLHVLALARRLDELTAALRARRWEARPPGSSLLGQTVLIVGLGSIGDALAARLAGFGVRLTGLRAHPGRGGPPGVAEVAGPDGLPRLLGQADVVVCCAMLDESTAGMFGAGQFAAMKPGALFVNVARGGLVDEAALLAALDAGQLGGAGLDVFGKEPADPDSPLLRHPRVFATPHAGGLTRTMFTRSGRVFAQNLERWAAGEPPRWAVNSPGFRRGRVTGPAG